MCELPGRKQVGEKKFIVKGQRKNEAPTKRTEKEQEGRGETKKEGVLGTKEGEFGNKRGTEPCPMLKEQVRFIHSFNKDLLDTCYVPAHARY